MNILTRPIFRVMCAGLLAGAIVGCGNKGPLVLPAKPPVTEAAVLPADDNGQADTQEQVDAPAQDQPAADQDQPAPADDTQPGR